MMLVVSGVGFLILSYAVGYMSGDEEERRYHAYKALFVFSMLLLVQSGTCSCCSPAGAWSAFLLPADQLLALPAHGRRGREEGVHHERGRRRDLRARTFRPDPAVGALDFETVFSEAPEAVGEGTAAAVVIALGLLGGAVAKSAQVPLHTWLPDAMEGPTPVSALIHAATMVTAGVYLIARTNVLFELAPAIHDLAGILGGVTILLAGLIALVQTDIKRVIAYSTMSQIGYMFVARRPRRLRRRDVPPDDARLLQGAPVPGRRHRHPRPHRRAGHPEDGRPRAGASRSRTAPSSSAPLRSPRSRRSRVLLQGRHPCERGQCGHVRLDPLGAGASARS